MTPQIDHIMTFIKVIETGSFTGAAAALNVSKSVISKHVTALETALSSQLLQRSTRKLSITDIGQAFYERVYDIPNQVNAALNQLQFLSDEPRGTLKLIAPTNFARSLKSVVIPNYLSKYPEASVDLQLVRPVKEYVTEAFDVIILWKLSHDLLPDYNMVAKKILTMNVGMYATPAYLKKHGTPKRPEDLKDHCCFSSIGDVWPFREKNGALSQQMIQGRLKTTSDEVIYETTMNNLGIAYAYPLLFEDDLKQKRVVPLLTRHTNITLDLYACYRPTQYLPIKISAFIADIIDYYESIQAVIASRGKH